MTVVSNSSPLIAFARIGQADERHARLFEIFDRVKAVLRLLMLRGMNVRGSETYLVDAHGTHGLRTSGDAHNV